MSVYDQQLAPVPSNAPEARIAQLEGQVKALLGQASNTQVGDYVYTSIVPNNWNTPGTMIIVQGNRLVPNGVNLSRADFPILNAAYALMGYPFGAGDGSTTFGTEDCLGRALVCVGTHADTGLSSDDGVATLANRTPKHNYSPTGLSTSAVSAGTPSGSISSVVVNGGGSPVQSGTGISVTTTLSFGNPTFTGSALGTHSHSITGTGGPGGTRPVDTGSYTVAGIYLLIVG